MKPKQVALLFINPQTTEKKPVTSSENAISKAYYKSNYLDSLRDKINILKKTNEFREMSTPPTSFKHYQALFDSLIERNQRFFTSEYGNNERDFKNYCLNKTNM